MPNAISLSEPALSLVRRRLTGERVAVTDVTRPAYQELADAGLAEPIHTPKGRDANYRLTLAAMDRKDELLNASTLAPSREESAAWRP